MKKFIIGAIIFALLILTGCETTPTYVYVQPECSIPERKALTEVDAGLLYDVLTLPHSLHPKDLAELTPELLNGYDGHMLYWDLKDNNTKLVDMILEREVVLKEVCKNGK